jgi:tellurite methyltransferase
MHSPLLNRYLATLKEQNHSLPILDLACGNGRNGLFCLEQNLIVTFADLKEQALAEVKQKISNNSGRYLSSLATFWQVDFEQQNSNPLTENGYSAVIVYRYLHRPLIEKIKAAVIPHGLIIYETFTVAQAELGRPKNPDYLLQTGELVEHFGDWEVLHYFEGTKISDTGTNSQAVAQIVARKPL